VSGNHLARSERRPKPEHSKAARRSRLRELSTASYVRDMVRLLLVLERAYMLRADHRVRQTVNVSETQHTDLPIEPPGLQDAEGRCNGKVDESYVRLVNAILSQLQKPCQWWTEQTSTSSIKRKATRASYAFTTPNHQSLPVTICFQTQNV
jgi:hypothetical protein